MTRLPAEWEPHDAVLLIWPHDATDWASRLGEAERVFLHLAAAINRHERLLVAAREPAAVRNLLLHNGIAPERIAIFKADSNDSWSRDCGPITVYENGKPVLLDFIFNGWGGKYAAGLDNQITRTLHQAGAFGNTPLRPVDLILEGGSIESDGKGTLLTTSACLLNPNRNGHLTPSQIGDQLKKRLGAQSIHWLTHGSLIGDDTDAHIDTLARLGPDNTILYVRCDDPDDAHFEALRAMEEEVHQMPFSRRIPLPWPAPHVDEDGQRLPATYANFLVLNGAVLVPVYNDPEQDAAALAAIETAFPGREIAGIDCRELIRQHGSLHCVTMQIPHGVLPAPQHHNSPGPR